MDGRGVDLVGQSQKGGNMAVSQVKSCELASSTEYYLHVQVQHAVRGGELRENKADYY
jgi:hypothetical protein